MQVIDVVPPIRPREELLTLTCHKPHAEAKLGVTVSSFEFPGQSGVHNLCRLVVDGSPMQLCGLRVGDKVMRVGGVECETASHTTALLAAAPAGPIELRVLRPAAVDHLRARIDPLMAVAVPKPTADTPLHADLEPPPSNEVVVGVMVVGVRSLAIASVLHLGDRLEMIGGVAVRDEEHARELFRLAPVGDVVMTVARRALRSPPISPDEEIAL